MGWRRFQACLLAVCALGGGCGHASPRPGGRAATAGMESAYASAEGGEDDSGLVTRPAPAAPTRALAAAAVKQPATQSAQRAPVLIYTAQLTLAIFEVTSGLKAVEQLARELDGFMARQTNSAITIRVPVARFHEAIGRIEKIGDITARDIQAEDVTQEHFDLQVRIKSARAVRERLEQLLARATKVDESIAIERELERVVGEIERLEGRLQYLQDRARFSTISVRFATRPKELIAKDTFRLPFGWLDQLGLGRLLNLGSR